MPTIPPLLILVVLIAVVAFTVIKACTRRTKVWIILAAVMSLLTFGTLGVGAVGLFGKMVAAVKDTDQLTQVLHSSDQKYSLTVPGSWRPMPELNDEACITAGSIIGNRFIIVIAEPQSGVQMDLPAYAKAATETMAESFQGSKLGAIEPVTLAGAPALRRLISGKSEGIDVVFQHTSLSAGDDYLQIMGWTVAGNESTAFERFNEILATFKAVPAIEETKGGAAGGPLDKDSGQPASPP